jgi:hypothetical protein
LVREGARKLQLAILATSNPTNIHAVAVHIHATARINAPKFK